MVDLEQLSKTVAVVVVPPPEKRKRSHKEGERSSFKRKRCEGSAPIPLPGGMFGTEFHVSHKSNFHMNSAERVSLSNCLKRKSLMPL